MSTYFTVIITLAHAGGARPYRRPFASVAEMDREMIDRWNSVVGPDDEVWYLGDFAIRQRPERVSSLVKALHGRKHLIVGNNDDAAVNGCDGWESIQPYTEVSIDGMHPSCATILSGPGGIWAGVGPTCMAIVTAA
jgi:calcineurin-like phosphoesterase family protein